MVWLKNSGPVNGVLRRRLAKHHFKTRLKLILLRQNSTHKKSLVIGISCILIAEESIL